MNPVFENSKKGNFRDSLKTSLLEKLDKFKIAEKI
jgi:hypothetical protein